MSRSERRRKAQGKGSCSKCGRIKKLDETGICRGCRMKTDKLTPEFKFGLKGKKQ